MATLHLSPAVDSKRDFSLSPARISQLSPNEVSSLESAFRHEYPISGSTNDDELVMLPFCRRGVTIPQLENEVKATKDKIAKATRQVIRDQKYYGKSYKDIYKDR